MSSHVATVIKSTRPPFLLLPLASVFLAIAIIKSSGADINILFAALVVIGALCAHVSVNALNEYQDYKSGLDFATIKTPFSGGSGSLLAQPASAFYVLLTAIVTLGITLIIGFYFMQHIGWALLPIGVLGALTIVLYTEWLNRIPLLCLIAPGLAFGPLMILGTETALLGDFSAIAIGLSLVVFFQANNLLLLNQFPDLEADKAIGRRHFPIAYGTKKSAWVYGLFTLASCAVIIVMVAYYNNPKLCLLALIPAGAGFVVMKGALNYASHIDKLIPFMGINVFITLATPVILGIALLLG